MKLFITVKSLGKRKNDLTKQAIELPTLPTTLRGLITAVVTLNVQQLHDKQQEVAWFPLLTAREIEVRGATGKVGFGSLYNEQQPDLAEALDTAVVAFEDGLYKVFIDEEEIGELDTQITLEEEDELVFIKFTMLAGRLW